MNFENDMAEHDIFLYKIQNPGRSSDLLKSEKLLCSGYE